MLPFAYQNMLINVMVATVPLMVRLSPLNVMKIQPSFALMNNLLVLRRSADINDSAAVPIHARIKLLSHLGNPYL